MSENNPEPQPAAPSDPAGGPQPQAEPPKPEPAPPWGDDNDFDPAKAWKLITDLRADNKKLAQREPITAEQKQQLAEWQQWQTEQQTELERANSELSRWQTEAESWRKSAQHSRIEALATEFHSPADALLVLGDREYLGAGGQIDEDAIRRDLAEVLQERPNWKRAEPDPTPAAPRPPAPNRNQGSGGGTPAPQDPREQFGVFLQQALSKH